jgi:Predicted O-methyltransferase
MERKKIRLTDFEKLSGYAAAFTHPENQLLKNMEDRAHQIYIPIMQPSAMALLQQLIRWTGAVKILELGTAIGYSAIRMKIAAGSDAEIFSVERDPDMIREAKKNIFAAGFSSSIHIITGDATDNLLAVGEHAPYDLILIDAAKAQYEHLFLEYARMLNAGGVIVTDNVFFHGLVTNIAGVRKKQLRRLVEKVDDFNRFLSEQNEFHTVFLTVGDGLAISTKKNTSESVEGSL